MDDISLIKNRMNSEDKEIQPDINKDNNIASNFNPRGVNKLSSYDWLKDLNFAGSTKVFDIIEVRFKNNRKEFYRVTDNEKYRKGDIVAVESNPGHDIGIVSLSGEIVRLQMKKKNADYAQNNFKKVYRKARQNDIEKWVNASSLETETMIQTRRIVSDLGLQMKINDVEYQGDNTKAIFYYTAEGRVDFRELIRKLAEKFSVRIEMKQIGVRQESSRLGGIGSCGRELCCSSWLTNFKSVSTITARTQQLSMNPQKLAGQCGKLKCCLNYEYENYKELSGTFPPVNRNLHTKSGEAFFQKMDVLSGLMWYSYKENPSKFIPLDKSKVKEILKLNKKGEHPDALEDFSDYKVEEAIKFDDIIDQEDLTRFDKKESPKKRIGSANRRRRNTSKDNRPVQNETAKEPSTNRRNNSKRNRNNRSRS